MRGQRGGVVLWLIVVLAVFYFFFLFHSMRGWGYAGYYDAYATQPSFWYWGGPHYYAGPSIRAGSTGGPAHMGGGPRAGK